MPELKLGKKVPKYDRRDLLMTKFLDTRKLPEIPEFFGHEGVIGDWRMLGNDNAGDCVFAGAAHETMLLSAMGGNGMVFDTQHVLADYSAVTGYNPADPNTDQGTSVRDAMNYRRSVGVADAFGNRHKIVAYVALEPGNIEHLRAALYLFGAVGIGVEFPESAMDQFRSDMAWSVVPGAQINGGHYIPLVAWRENLVAVSWGKLVELTPTFYTTFCDEAWAFVSEEFIKDGKSPEGFALADLLSDLANL